MALIDISPAPSPAALSQTQRRRSVKEKNVEVVIRASDFSLQNPLIPALTFALCLRVFAAVAHLWTRGSWVGFWPATWPQVAVWSADFVLPYLALRFFAVAHRASRRNWRKKVAQGLERGHELQKVSILGFARMSEVRDADTGDHILRMSHYSRLLTEEMGKLPENRAYVTRQYCEEIFLSAPLHDIGKVGIVDSILKKRGSLTADEFEIMKMHTILGGDLLNELELKLGFRTFYSLGKQIAYHHHQRYDGAGYPNVLGASRAMFVDAGIGKPLQGKDIPLSARIVALADVYDALISRRCYKEPMPHEAAREHILDEAGKHFDPDVVAAFARSEEKMTRIAREFAK